ncbi:putative periplasmic serine endoprotease DegP-like precursor [Rubripirellula lacrimiformis]|uniref:Putative periplasmic serine endoprotease DegP-like n=1 Tax=Rubripirellula lacrimiformis TaxID=1930273 RepID=A0A517N4M2_9BACT|nr:PDZ domain-containing protein [Rubripirellula lacrimiformis]QDT01958.1 putative periplasmic serine endoprotease DegP-like precursor [Rubripirellula lacrimiformis]
MWTKCILATFCILPCLLTALSYGQDAVVQPVGDHEYARFGIEVTDSPGVGVHVAVVVIDGPADHGGIRPGDYLMAINGQPIEKPADLVAAIRTHKPGTEVLATVWHEGQESDKKVVLATASRTAHRAGDAYLGVTLEANGTIGAKISQVIPGSPAATAQLKPGDVIVAINETKIDSAKDLVDAIESRKSGDSITLTLAGDTDNQREVQLGAGASAPPIFSFRMPVAELDDRVPGSFAPPQSWRAEMSELRRQLEELREAIIDEGEDIMDLDEDTDSTPSESAQPQPRDASRMDASDASFQFVDYHTGRRSDHGPVYRHRPAYRYSYPYRPNDGYWYGGRPRPAPYSSYYRGAPAYRQFYQRDGQPGVQVYVGPFGFQYYYR